MVNVGDLGVGIGFLGHGHRPSHLFRARVGVDIAQMRVLICGDREWTDRGMIDSYLLELVYDVAILGNGPLIIIEGEARGADRIAREQCEYHGIEFLPFPADWGKYGKAAGPIRNQQMLDEGKPDLVVAFHDSIEEKSKGTKDMVRRARAAGIPTEVISHVRQVGKV